jgi:hypothetical protein
VEGTVLQTIDLTAAEVFHYSAEEDTDGDNQADTQICESSTLRYRGQDAVHLRGTPANRNNPTINPLEPNPYIGGMGISFSAAPVELRPTDYVQIRVFPTASVTLILEVYENDAGNPNEIDKNPANYYLPAEEDDFFKVVINLEPNGKWQTINVPFSTFTDWNRRTFCSASIPGVNENIGNGIFDPTQGEALAFQLTMVSDSWGPEVKDLYIGKEINFVRPE